MTVLVTGACGRVGTALTEYLDDGFNIRCFDRRDHPACPTTVGDVADYPSLASAVDGVDALVHLAAASRVEAPWPDVLTSNIVGGYNALEAARRHEVERVVLASTNHVVGMYEEEHRPALYSLDYDLHLDETAPVRPDSHYATTKVFNEAQGRYYVEGHEFPKRVYVLRIGSVRGPDEDHPYADAERGVRDGKWSRDSDRYDREVTRMKATWQSRRDIAHLVECCLRDESVRYDVFYGVSDNDCRWLDIEHANSVLDYRPRDNGEEWDEPPAMSWES